MARHERDGLLDVVTARVNDPILFGKPSGQLIWLEQPKSEPLDNVPWTEHYLVVDGPETVFVLTDLNPSDDQYEVFAAQFFTKHLGLSMCSQRKTTLYYIRGTWTRQ